MQFLNPINATLNGYATLAGYANSLYNSSFAAGEALAANDVIFLQTDNKWYKANVNNRIIPFGTILARCAAAYVLNATVGAYPRGYFSLPTGLGTIATYQDIFIRGTIISGSFTTDGTITTVLSPGYSYMRIGACINSASYIYYDGNNQVYTLSSTGYLKAVDNLFFPVDSPITSGTFATGFPSDAAAGQIHFFTDIREIWRYITGEWQRYGQGEQTTKVTIGDTAPTTPAIGDIWIGGI